MMLQTCYPCHNSKIQLFLSCPQNLTILRYMSMYMVKVLSAHRQYIIIIFLTYCKRKKKRAHTAECYILKRLPDCPQQVKAIVRQAFFIENIKCLPESGKDNFSKQNLFKIFFQYLLVGNNCISVGFFTYFCNGLCTF